MIRLFIPLIFMFIGFTYSEGQNTESSNPQSILDATEKKGEKIGLTLSGGGARGFAHIGVLHIIDSLGIELDYITGTSMGAVIGGLYAAGYSAFEIEKIALERDWNALFSSAAMIRYIHPSRRKLAEKNLVSLPYENGKLIYETGALDAPMLWNELGNLFLHISHIHDFTKLPIPFACVATDLENGEEILLSKGDLVASIRASMAIPGVFSPVEIDSRVLIDGGVVNNFPVGLVKDMGADRVIGVNVSRGLRKVKELRTPLDVIYQMGFFSNARQFEYNKSMTDIYIEPELQEFSAAGFGEVMEMIEKGKAGGRAVIHKFKEMADKPLDTKELNVQTHSTQMGKSDFILRDLQFEGLDRVSEEFVIKSCGIELGDSLNGQLLTDLATKLYATNLFERVRYNLVNRDGDYGDLTMHFIERPQIQLFAGLAFSSFKGVSIGGGMEAENFLLKNSQLRLSVSVGESPIIRGRFVLFSDYEQTTWFDLQMDAGLITFPYEGFNQFTRFRNSELNSRLAFNALSDPDSYWSIGMGYHLQRLSQRIEIPININGWTSGWTLFTGWNRYTLDRHAFPTVGDNVEIEAKVHFGQSESLDIRDEEDNGIQLEELGLEFQSYIEFKAKWDFYRPLSNRITQNLTFQFGYKLDYNQGFLNGYNVGGTRHFLIEQMLFMGLKEYDLITPSFTSLSGAWQYEIGRKFYSTLQLNAGFYDFDLANLSKLSSDDFLIGIGSSIGYLSILGPIELNFAFSPYNNNIIGYLNLGWDF